MDLGALEDNMDTAGPTCAALNIPLSGSDSAVPSFGHNSRAPNDRTLALSTKRKASGRDLLYTLNPKPSTLITKLETLGLSDALTR